jgi:predicted GNAT family acetyltransferase
MKILKGNNRFFIGESEENDVARITFYYKEENVIVIDHTFVSPELRGQSVAGKLLSEVVNFAKENNLLIIPVCSYAVKVMSRPGYEDILYKDSTIR